MPADGKVRITATAPDGAFDAVEITDQGTPGAAGRSPDLPDPPLPPSRSADQPDQPDAQAAVQAGHRPESDAGWS